MNDRVRYTRQNIVSNNFYQLPKFLFDTEFGQLSNDARVLYALLRNRHEISIKNGWFDENDEVYLYFKREDMQNMLHLSNKTVIKAMKDLKDFKLLDEVRQGVSKPNRIYLLSALVGPLGIEVAENLENTMKCKKYTSRHVENTHQDVEILHPNQNNKIHNNVNQGESQKPPAPIGEYGEFRKVRLTAGEHTALVMAFERDKATEYIDRLDRHIASTGKRYESHYATIKKWIAEDESKAQNRQSKPSRFANCAKHNRDYAELERMEQQLLTEGS